jgi:hypothetical protein
MWGLIAYIPLLNGYGTDWFPHVCLGIVGARTLYLQAKELQGAGPQAQRWIQAFSTIFMVCLCITLYGWVLFARLGSFMTTQLNHAVQNTSSFIEFDPSALTLAVIVLVMWECIRRGRYWAINGVRTRSSSSDTFPHATVIVPGATAVTVPGLEKLSDSIAVLISTLTTRWNNPTTTSVNNSMTEAQGSNADRTEAIEKQLSIISHILKSLQNQIDEIPKIEAVVATILELTDVVQEEAATTRNVVRELTEPGQKTNSIQITGGLEQTDFIPLIANARNKDIKKHGVPRRPALARSDVTNASAVPTDSGEVTRKGKTGLILTKEMLEEFAGKTQDEVVKELARRERERRNVERGPENLSEQEKALAASSLATLDREWRQKAGIQVKTTDYIEIGTLDAEQQHLPRQAIRKIIQSRRTACFVQRLKDQGREVIRCEQCGQLSPTDSPHNCFFAAGWSRNTTKDGIPANKGILFSQQGKGGVHIRPKIAVDPERAKQNYDKMIQYKMVAEDSYQPTPAPKNDKNTTITPVLETPPSSADDNTVGKEDRQAVELESVAVEVVDDYMGGEITCGMVQDKSTGQVFRLIPC